MMVTRGVILEVKKLAFAFGVLWKVRTGAADLMKDLEAAPRLAVSRNGCRIVNAILNMLRKIVWEVNQLCDMKRGGGKLRFCR